MAFQAYLVFFVSLCVHACALCVFVCVCVITFKMVLLLYVYLPSVWNWFQDCAAVILYTAEAATKMALDTVQILGELFICASLLHLQFTPTCMTDTSWWWLLIRPTGTPSHLKAQRYTLLLPGPTGIPPHLSAVFYRLPLEIDPTVVP